MTTRAVIYTRVSRDHQEVDGTSLDTQRAACERYCADHGYQVIEYFTDTYTGAKWRERPGLSALRELLRAGGIDVIVSYDLDRLSRHQAHTYLIAEEVEDNGARIEFVTENFEDSAVGRFIRSARAFAAEVEREKIVERSTRGRRARVQSGKLNPNARPLYGYRWRDSTKGQLDIDPVTSLVVRRIYDEALTGTSLRKIVQGLFNDGIPSPYGKPSWSLTSVRRVLTHPHYTGNAYGWWRVAEVGRYDPAEAIPLPEGTIPALVTEEEQALVAARLKHNKAFASRNNHNPYQALLRGGYARCGICGHSLVTNPRLQYPCYQCNASSVRPDLKHTAVTYKLDELDTLVWGKIVNFLTNPTLVEQQLRDHQSQTDTTAAAIAGIDQALAEVDRQTGNLVQSLAALDDTAPVISELNRLNARKQSLSRERQQLAMSKTTSVSTSAQIQELWEWCAVTAANLETLTYAERREILFALGITVRVYTYHTDPRVIVTATMDGISPIVFP